jgi:hypothetical protein
MAFNASICRLMADIVVFCHFSRAFYIKATESSCSTLQSYPNSDPLEQKSRRAIASAAAKFAHNYF